MGQDKSPPLPLEIKLGLRAGTVYYFVANDVNSPSPHYFIVVNHNPLGDSVLLLSIVTSKIEKAFARNVEHPELVVVIKREEYKPLEVDSAVECTKVFRRSLHEIAAKMNAKEIGIFQPDLPKGVLARIRAALLTSPAISDAEKDIIFSKEEIAAQKLVSQEGTMAIEAEQCGG